MLNKLSPFSAFLYGNPFSLTLRLSLRRPWNPFTFKFMARWRLHPPQISIMKPMAQSTLSDSGQAISSCIQGTTQGKHILWVAVDHTSQYGLGEMILYSPRVTSRKRNFLNENLRMIKKLRKFVKEDLQKAPSERIDSVLLYADYSDEPTTKLWHALDGLAPKHLELIASVDCEDCHVEPLNTLKHQWNDLESLTLHNICEPNFLTRAPNVFSQISSLTLDHCCSIEDFPIALTGLKHLRILENNACDMFGNAVDNIPSDMTNGLEVLEIESTNGCDFACAYDPQDFRDRLRKCTNLSEFRLAASYRDSLDTDLASYIPPFVEKLALRFTRSLPFLHDIDDWIMHACDRTWLPYLGSFQLTVDPESRVRGLKGDAKSGQWTRILENPPRKLSPEAFDKEFERKRGVLYAVLKSCRPGIDLLT